ncbi:MAG: hypothetical protein ABI707_11960 [Ferruginibacter sp.]
MKIKFSIGCWLMIIAIMLMGCSFEKIGQDAGKGLGKSLGPAADSIGRNLVNSIRTELTKDSSRKDLEHFIDSVLTPVFVSLRNTSGSVRDSFINNQTRIWVDSLMQTVTGENLNRNLQILQASLVGKTKQDIFEIERSVHQLLTQILAEALGDTTRVRLGLLRDELLGPKTSTALSKIIDTAVTHIVDSAVTRFSQRFRSDVDPLLRDDVSFVKKNANMLLISLAVVAAIIITLIWLNRKKYLQMVAMLTKQIHDIPDQKVYDEVTAKIKNEAVTAGLEPTLRAVLNKNGLLNSEAWKKPQS